MVNVYSFKSKLNNVFLQPMFFDNEETMLFEMETFIFTMLKKGDQNQIRRMEKNELFLIGEFDYKTGTIKGTKPKLVLKMNDFINKKIKEINESCKQQLK